MWWSKKKNSHSLWLLYNESIVFIFLYYCRPSGQLENLNCPFCGARLGALILSALSKMFLWPSLQLYISPRAVPIIHAYRPGRLMRPSLKYLSHPIRVQSGCDKETLLTGGRLQKQEITGFLNMGPNNNGPGRLTEALCLEVRSTYFQKDEAEKLLFKASDPKYQLFVPQLVTTRCAPRLSWKSHSLDLSISEKLTLLPTLYEIHSKTAVYLLGSNETQPVDLWLAFRIE